MTDFSLSVMYTEWVITESKSKTHETLKCSLLNIKISGM